MEKRVRPANHFLRKCYLHKKMTWHLGTGLKGEPYLCIECVSTFFGSDFFKDGFKEHMNKVA